MPEDPPNVPLVEGLDYYIENGLWVFTAEAVSIAGLHSLLFSAMVPAARRPGPAPHVRRF